LDEEGLVDIVPGNCRQMCNGTVVQLALCLSSGKRYVHSINLELYDSLIIYNKVSHYCKRKCWSDENLIFGKAYRRFSSAFETLYERYQHEAVYSFQSAAQ
jgi:hypothetical protein